MLRLRPPLLHTSLLLGLSLLFSAAACSDDDDGAARGASGQGAEGGGDGEASSAGAGGSSESKAGAAGQAEGGQGAGGTPDSGSRLYVSSLRKFNPEGSVGYLFSVPSLDADATVNLDEAVEIEDAWAFGDADPYFYIATIFAPTLARWEVSP